MEKTQVVLFSRVSSALQNNQLKDQEEQLKQYSESNNFEAVKSFREISSAVDDREVFNSMLEFANKNNIHDVVVISLDRFCKTEKDFYEVMNKYNLKLHILNENRILTKDDKLIY